MTNANFLIKFGLKYSEFVWNLYPTLYKWETSFNISVPQYSMLLMNAVRYTLMIKYIDVDKRDTGNQPEKSIPGHLYHLFLGQSFGVFWTSLTSSL